MGVFDKIKNALFEEEYVEIEEKPKKPKKSKIKEKKVKEEKVKEEETPIAKKVVLPEKKEKIETLEEEELDSNDYEFRPKDDIDKNELLEKRRDFRIMDDEDFRVDDEEITDDGEELKIVPVVEEVKEETRRDEIEVIGNDNYRMNEDDFPFKDKDDRFNVNDYSGSWNDNYKEKKSYVDDLNNSTEEVKNDYSYPPVNASRGLYGIDNSTKITMHEYGTYERKEEKSYFKPSPIISPIYGILDKNYKKEDVIQKREIKMSNSFERDKVSIDDIRKKAYGTLTDDFEDEFRDTNDHKEVVEEKEEENLLVDLNDEKPTVKEVTMGDAVEYFEDLGLEYNVDYVDDSKKQVVNEVVEEPVIEEVPKREEKVEKKPEKRVEKEEKKEEEIPKIEEPEVKVVPERLEEDEVELVEDKKETEEEMVKDDDNLFDLIDSMYQE